MQLLCLQLELDRLLLQLVVRLRELREGALEHRGGVVGDIDVPAQLHLALRGGGQLDQHFDFVLRPGPRMGVNGAEGANRLAAHDNRDADVGRGAECAHGGHVTVKWVGGGVGYHQGIRTLHRVVTEGRSGQLTNGRERFPESTRRLVEVPIGVDQRDERGGHAHDAHGEAGQPIEDFFDVAVEQPGRMHGRDTDRIGTDRGG